MYHRWFPGVSWEFNWDVSSLPAVWCDLSVLKKLMEASALTILAPCQSVMSGKN